MVEQQEPPHPRFDPVRRWFQGMTSEPRRLLREGVHPGERMALPTRVVLGAYLLTRALIDSDLPVRAASTAYTFVFSLVPLLTTSLAFFTAFPGLHDQRANLQQALFTYLLPRAVRNVQQYLNQFSEAAAAAGVVSSLVFLLTIILLFHSLEHTFNLIWKPERGRTWRERLQVLALFFVVGAVAVMLMVLITRELSALSARVAALEPGGLRPILERVGLTLGNLMAAWAVFIIANKVIPSTRVRWVAAVVGGVSAGTVWHLLKGGFTWYVDHVASYKNIYGALGTVPVFFLWLYLTFLLLLAGAYAAFVTQNLRTLLAIHRARGQRGQLRAYYAVAATATLAHAFRHREPPLTAVEIAERLGVAPYFVARVVGPLAEAGIVLALLHRTEQTRYSLAVPSEALSVGEVIRIATGEDLTVPETKRPVAVHQRIADLFTEAKRQEGNLLERVFIAELETDVPARLEDANH